MHHHQQQQPKRRKKRILHGTKTVTVVRGKLGYGFTISGQHPCMLSSIVAGSPADQAGLKPGDLLYFVNGLNVTKSCHDDVVRMVGLSTGTLELQVAENCNSSDSSDDDYLPRSKSRYPNRVRQRNAPNERGSKGDSNSDGKRQQKPVTEDSDPSFSPASTDDIPWTKPPIISRQSKHELRNNGVSSGRQVSSRGNDAEGFAFSAIQKGPIVSTAKISSAAAVVKKVRPVSVPSRHYRQLSFPQAQSRADKPVSLCRYSSGPAIPFHESEEDEEEEAEVMPVVAESVRAVVGYIGSIEMPSSHTRPHQRLQALRNAVRRLRVEKRVHTLVLMQVSASGITLINSLGKEVASYPSNRIAFSGICPDDKHFFGVVTLGLPDDNSSQMGADRNGPLSSSCHIFMIEPELSSHSAHIQQADVFQIQCTTNPQTRRCDEFPISATSLILCIANLYRDGPPRQFDNEIVQSHAFADPVRHGHRINSNSSSNGNNSNSDSGLGFGREDAPLEQNEQVCVVDLPNSNSSGSSATIDTSGMSVVHHMSPEVVGFGTPRPPNSTQRPLSSYDMRRGLNNSTSSEECWQSSKAALNKLTPRAMPDPPHKMRSRSTADLSPTSVTMDDMRESMQRLLQARQRQLQEQNQHLESDRESTVGNPVLSLSVADNGQAILEGGQPSDHIFAVPSELPPGSSHHPHSASVSRSAFQVPRPVSAPLGRQKTPTLVQAETVDMEAMGKLSPRAFPNATSPPSSVFRSPSAPPAPFFPHRESDDDDDDEEEESEDDPYIKRILDQFRRDRAVNQHEDTRRFSEGFALAQKREKEKYETGNLQKWTKSSSLRRGQPQPTMLKQSFSQSHESLAVHDEAPPIPSHRLVAASSVNNVTKQSDGFDASDKPGRVAGWAVNFDKLLQDAIGLSVFTAFLKKEFSEENVIFWTACEQYRKISDEQQRKAHAQEIYSRHLSSKASDPVNVDSAAKLYTEKFLDNPTAIMFDVAQLQIFQLMRQDSYSRFLKSDLYKNYLLKEIEGQPLIDPVTGNPESNVNGIGKGEKKKGKGKENEEKRRRSILPWRQHKKSTLKSTSDPELKKLGKKSKEEKVKEKEPNNNINDDTNLNVIVGVPDELVGAGGKKAAGPGIDLSTMRKEVFHPKEARDAPESHFKFCRIILPDGSTTVVCAKPGQTCRIVLSKLCEKRSIALSSVDVFLNGSNKPLDLEEDISVLGSKEIVIFKRVLFRLDLPNGKSIGVKAKPNRSVIEVFKPILHKYGFTMESVTVHLVGSQDPIDMDQEVSYLDNERVVISSTDSSEAGRPPLSARQAKAFTGKGKAGGGGGGSLEEITNQIFDDLMRGKSQLAHGFDELGVVELDKAKVNKNEEGRSLGLFGLLRKESWGAKDKRTKNKGKVTFTLPGTDGKKKSKEKDGEHLIRLLSGAQGLRLEDQRGVEVATGEMPSFLNQDVSDVRGSNHHGVVEVHMDQQPGDVMSGMDRMMEESVLGKDASHGRNHNLPGNTAAPRYSSPSPHWQTSKMSETPRGRKEPNSSKGLTSSDKWNNLNKSFGPDSVIPSPNTAMTYFQMSPEIIDSQKYSSNSHTPRTVSSHVSNHPNESHSFRSPQDSLHSSFSPSTKAPVASPEKFSPENKKSHSPDSNGGPAMMILPSKMSPSFHSSHSSSSSSTSSQPRPSPVLKPQQPQTVSRMSDGMLLHKLQRARKANNMAQRHSNPLSYSTNNHRAQPSDLAQRALLSPRFNDSGHTLHPDENHIDMAQRALLSPRFNQSYYNTSPIPNSNSNAIAQYPQYIYNNDNHNRIPSPVRTSSSQFKVNTSETHVQARPISSSSSPQYSSWHYRSSPRQFQIQSHSSVPRQTAVSFDYIEDAGETVTFV